MLFFSAMSTVASRQKLGSDRAPTQSLSTNQVNVNSRNTLQKPFSSGPSWQFAAQESQTLVYAKGKT